MPALGAEGVRIMDNTHKCPFWDNDEEACGLTLSPCPVLDYNDCGLFEEINAQMGAEF
jgi:hypothetical protein